MHGTFTARRQARQHQSQRGVADDFPSVSEDDLRKLGEDIKKQKQLTSPIAICVQHPMDDTFQLVAGCCDHDKQAEPQRKSSDIRAKFKPKEISAAQDDGLDILVYLRRTPAGSGS